jgi:hypothetical protein
MSAACTVERARALVRDKMFDTQPISAGGRQLPGEGIK